MSLLADTEAILIISSALVISIDFARRASFSVTAVGKLEFIPVVRDTDPLIIGNIPALTEMCQALRGYSQETVVAHTLAERHERRAKKTLKDEMDHYLGVEQPAVAVDRTQQASFRRLGLSTNI